MQEILKSSQKILCGPLCDAKIKLSIQEKRLLSTEDEMRIEPERLAYWYLRLNGFFTVTNFLVHPETRKDYSTEVDVLGVRFPFRKENFKRPMTDDELFTRHDGRLCLVIAEVKSGPCDLNESWGNPEKRNMEKVLAAIGVFPQSCCWTVADSLYKIGCFQDDNNWLSLLCIGRCSNEAIQNSFSRVPQITFDDILRFIHRRLVEYLDVKEQHEQWDCDGQALWETVSSHRREDEFLGVVHVELDTSTRGPNPSSQATPAS